MQYVKSSITITIACMVIVTVFYLGIEYEKVFNENPTLIANCISTIPNVSQ